MRIILKTIGRIHLIALLAVWSCMPDAKRDNPFDPKSHTYRPEGTLTGRVTRLYTPFLGIEGVTVILTPSEGSAVTDGEGFYAIEGIPAGDFRVIVRKSGYAEDSTTVRIAAGRSDTANFPLDGLPFFLETRITSTHDRPSPSDDRYFFHFEARLDDPDGISDIDSVTVRVDALGFHEALALIPNTNQYRITVSPDEITTESLEALVGQEAVFCVSDQIGLKVDSPPTHLVRIIHSSPSTVTPREQDVADSPQPLLVWDAFSAPFSFTYTVDIKSAFSTGWQKTGISPDTTSVRVSNPLESRWSHYWAVWVVDKHGNSSESPYVTFWVAGGK